MRSDRIIVLCTAALGAAYLITTARIPSVTVGDPVGPKVFPMLLGIALLVGAGMLFLEGRRGASGGPGEVADGDPQVEPISWGVVGGILAWTILYALVYERLGYMLATAPYLLGLMAVFHAGKWVTNILVAVIFSIGSYVLFTNLLGVQLPRGLLPY